MSTSIRVRYRVEGIVQGVGFRPFVYTLALRIGCKGFVLNDALGVLIELQGSPQEIHTFEKALYAELPPLARIDALHTEVLPCVEEKGFEIRASHEGLVKSSLVLPDMSICDACLAEMRDPKNRRYRYYFTNCTHCGPRYSIIQDLPYDRPNTSMHPFSMCDACQAEYTNPLDRRYHAQPISCPTCGPEVSLYTIQGVLLSRGHEAILEFAALIRRGEIVAMKGMGGFHLMCDASNDASLHTLRVQKRRPTKPFAVMCPSLESAKMVCEMSAYEEEALSALLRPIVLLKRKASDAISPLVAPKIDRLGLFLPYTPLHVRLLELLDRPIVATSANRSGEPILKDATSLKACLGESVSYYLDYNREIIERSDDSVVQLIENRPLWMRLSRGVAPLSFRLACEDERTLLAVGAQQKNAIAIYHHRQIILSPYIGDMDNVATLELFEHLIAAFKRFYNLTFDAIIADKHPQYASTQWAKSQGIPLLEVQHHYAHLLSVMCEQGLHGNYTGVAWDGTGYGDDGNIWGGEVMVCSTHGYERVLSFEPMMLLGGEASIKEIRRLVASMLWDLEGRGVAIEGMLEHYFRPSELKLLRQLYDKRLNAPLTSSVGRLFDAVACVCGLERVSYDGESGLYLEGLYDATITEHYPFEIQAGIIYYKESIALMIHDAHPRLIASKFINMLVQILLYIEAHYPDTMILSGGVFQNRTLLEAFLRQAKKEPILPQKLPPNDGGICVGQLYFALNFYM